MRQPSAGNALASSKFRKGVFATIVGAAAALGPDGLSESPDGPEAVKVYYTEAEALAKVFAKADTLLVETWLPSPEEKEELKRQVQFYREGGFSRKLAEHTVMLERLFPTLDVVETAARRQLESP